MNYSAALQTPSTSQLIAFSANVCANMNSPYYVHINDTNGASLVNPPLNGTNYHT